MMPPFLSSGQLSTASASTSAARCEPSRHTPGERARKTAKHRSALAGIDRYPVSPGRDVGFEYVAHLAHVELERKHILGAFESVDAVDVRALAGDDVLQQPTGRSALESADFQYAKTGLALEFVQQARPDRNVLRKPILAEVHCRGTLERSDAVRRGLAQASQRLRRR